MGHDHMVGGQARRHGHGGPRFHDDETRCRGVRRIADQERQPVEHLLADRGRPTAEPLGHSVAQPGQIDRLVAGHVTSYPSACRRTVSTPARSNGAPAGTMMCCAPAAANSPMRSVSPGWSAPDVGVPGHDAERDPLPLAPDQQRQRAGGRRIEPGEPRLEPDHPRLKRGQPGPHGARVEAVPPVVPLVPSRAVAENHAASADVVHCPGHVRHEIRRPVGVAAHQDSDGWAGGVARHRPQ